ncbi:caspase-7 [Diabrotica virgifera virgifera]|uniref:Caspase-7-like n=1 Tax=Diabrotica virgifera virgifera TaxID=50390 RepID=A0ABM5IGZ7_DIAVI|nr:caspase-7 [Diabrotica virgifera virgifera]
MATERDAGVFKPQKLLTPPPPETPPATSRSPFRVVDDLPVKKFVERKHLRTDRFEYERKGDDPGYIIIFNQETFYDKELGTRRGTRRDVNELTTCLQRLGFNIDKENILTDKTTEEVEQVLEKASQIDFTNYNCLILFFLSHGEELNFLHTKDGQILAKDIWLKFKDSPGLNGKPKMFVFQACKGENFTTVGNELPKSAVLTPSSTFSPDYLYDDLLIVHSSTEGNCAFRNQYTGSWFIQELCKNFTAYGRKDEVISLIIRVTKCVSNNFTKGKDPTTNLEYSNAKQMPFFISTLRKKFYLNRTKERDAILRIAETNEHILKTLVEIKTQLDHILANDDEKKHKK